MYDLRDLEEKERQQSMDSSSDKGNEEEASDPKVSRVRNFRFFRSRSQNLQVGYPEFSPSSAKAQEPESDQTKSIEISSQSEHLETTPPDKDLEKSTPGTVR